MLDIKFIVENTDWVKKSLGKKGFPAEKVDELIKVYLDLNKTGLKVFCFLKRAK